MENTLIFTFPTGEAKEMQFRDFSDIVVFCNTNGLTKPDAERNKHTTVTASSDTPKGRLKEIKTALKGFGLDTKLQFSDNIDWERGAIGAKVDWNADEAMISRGVDIKNPKHVESFKKVIALGKTFAEAWKKLKDAEIVKVDANFHVKKLEQYQIKKSVTPKAPVEVTTAPPPAQ